MRCGIWLGDRNEQQSEDRDHYLRPIPDLRRWEMLAGDEECGGRRAIMKKGIPGKQDDCV
jgi:hypothetical protein